MTLDCNVKDKDAHPKWHKTSSHFRYDGYIRKPQSATDAKLQSTSI